MKIHFGYELVYECAQATPMLLSLSVAPHPGQTLLIPDSMQTEPGIARRAFRDVFGNVCTRVEAPAGTTRITADALIEDPGVAEFAAWNARETPIAELPHEILQYLLPSRYCESDLLGLEAQRLFGHLAPGWSRVQAICDFVNSHITFGYQFARSTKTAAETYRERQGVCRDFAHLGIAFCRALNIPARYVTAYLGDIGVPATDAPMDFAGSMEVFLDGAWHSFDPRNNARRVGRLVIAHGRDAADVAITTSFGPALLRLFRVWTDEVSDSAAQALMAQRLEPTSRAA